MTTPGSPDEVSRSEISPIPSLPSDSSGKRPIEENIFLEDAAIAAARTSLPPLTSGVAKSGGLPGPGLPEALLWVVGCFVAHTVGSIAMAIFAVALTAGSTGQVPNQIDVEQILKEQMLLLAGGEQLFFVLFAMLAIFVRFGSNRGRHLGLRPPKLGHALLIVALVFPVAFVSGECFHVATQGWQGAVQFVNEFLAGVPWWIPVHEFIVSLDKNQAMEVMKEMSGAPLPLLLMIIAVAPALGEELIFRGLIGRGLVARWGIVRGVLLTSLLFGAVHLHPAHALAVIPLGVAMHFVYLTTRSFWAPVLLHFLNNAWATLVTKYSTQLGSSEMMAENTSLPLPVLIQSLNLAVVIAMLLWQARAKFVTSSGNDWSPGYATTEAPPPQVAAELIVHWPTRRLLAHGLLTFAAFVVVLWQNG